MSTIDLLTRNCALFTTTKALDEDATVIGRATES